METESKQSNKISIPTAIILAGIIIGGAVIYSSNRTNTAGTANQPQQQQVAQQTGDLDQMAAISDSDHVRGNPDAPVKIVEYSDTECPFCKRFHSTMQEVMNEYGKDGKVAWVYRHFPLDQLHSKARKE
ncbi:MAG: Sodium/proton antiporter, partial [Parcubacteria group bacterium GW2011_GWA1_38_7]